MADLSVSFAGIHFKNPIVVASIEPSDGMDHIKHCIDSGAGGVVIKTVTDIPRMSELTTHSKYAVLNDKGEIIKGPPPRFFTFYSRSGYSTKPPGKWTSIIKESKKYADAKGVRLIGSLGASSIKKWIELAKMQEESGVDMMELNFGCPHPSQMNEVTAGMLIGQDAGLATEITAAVVRAIRVPVVVKLTPQVDNPVRIAEAVHRAGASGVTVINRFTGFAVNIEEGKPYIDGPAGVGGPWMKPLVLRWVHSIYQELGIPIAGTNGIYDWREAVEFIMSGATLMEVGSVLMLKGYGHVHAVLRGLDKFMDRKKYKTIESMIGIASRRSVSYEETFHLPTTKPSITQERCIRCFQCVRSCFYDALERKEDHVESLPENCIGCELCYSVCPADAISFSFDPETHGQTKNSARTENS